MLPAFTDTTPVCSPVNFEAVHITLLDAGSTGAVFDCADTAVDVMRAKARNRFFMFGIGKE
jgi:hypothetical protein